MHDSRRYVLKEIYKKILSEGIIQNLTKYVTPRARIAFIEKSGYKMLGAGSARYVYDLENGTVLKLAIDEKGIEQNRFEANFYKSLEHSPAKDFFCKIIYGRPDNSWLVVEKVIPFTSKEEFEAEALSGIRIEMFDEVVETIEMGGMKALVEKIEYCKQLSERVKNPLWKERYETYQQLKDNPIIVGLAPYMKKLEANAGDLGRYSSYGKTRDDRIVVIDYGLSNDALSYYQKSPYQIHDEAMRAERDFDFDFVSEPTEDEFGNPIKKRLRTKTGPDLNFHQNNDDIPF